MESLLSFSRFLLVYKAHQGSGSLGVSDARIIPRCLLAGPLPRLFISMNRPIWKWFNSFGFQGYRVSPAACSVCIHGYRYKFWVIESQDKNRTSRLLRIGWETPIWEFFFFPSSFFFPHAILPVEKVCLRPELFPTLEEMPFSLPALASELLLPSGPRSLAQGLAAGWGTVWGTSQPLAMLTQTKAKRLCPTVTPAKEKTCWHRASLQYIRCSCWRWMLRCLVTRIFSECWHWCMIGGVWNLLWVVKSQCTSSWVKLRAWKIQLRCQGKFLVWIQETEKRNQRPKCTARHSGMSSSLEQKHKSSGKKMAYVMPLPPLTSNT